MQPFPIENPPPVPFPCMSLRSRREVNTRDAANVRQFEHMQTDAPYLTMDRPDLSGSAILNDMNPTNSRSQDSSLYRQNQPFLAGRDSFTQNPYFRDYPPNFDPRNAVREIRAAVFEDRFDRGTKESQRLLARNFTNSWFAPDYVEKQNLASLRAYQDLMPRMDDIEKNYRR
jgi:hypothetical protein